ncbi:PID-CTERM protein-sorting domain-containing protein [Pedobacter sp. B4-66]|uniref:PID-CTERM protein-sorting domain-containing protein n=1 Tax=Pedobacter sp. B4-66 TaxID=2817280 RepID=UPI001BD9D023|nr:hypothetical protein [Pedobacter sp. B4-66]
MRKHALKKQTLIILLILLNSTAMAQGDDPGLPGNDPDVPLDGGISLLLAAGAVYGIKKIRQLKP